MSDAFAGVIRDAQNLRDYALLSGSTKPDGLIESVTPFDLNPGLRDEEKLKQLQIEVASTAKAIDPDTRHKVLLGEFRRTASRPGSDGGNDQVSGYSGFRMSVRDRMAAALLILIGIVTLWLLSSYSMLAVRNAQWLTEYLQRGEINYVPEMNTLFTIAASRDPGFAGTGEGADPGKGNALQPELAAYNFISGVSRLNAMVASDSALLNEAYAIELNYYWCQVGGGVWPQAQRFLNLLVPAQCPPPRQASEHKSRMAAAIDQTTTRPEYVSLSQAFTEALQKVELARDQINATAAESRRSASYAAEQVEMAQDSWRSTSRLLFNAVAGSDVFPKRELVITTGVKALSQETSQQWITALSALEKNSDPRNYNTLLAAYGSKLQRYSEIMNRWILPVLFGALGAIVLCLTRTASKFYATPSFAGIFSRLALAMLGGALISIIFAPTYFAEGVKSGSSFVFLLCFVFGYSTSAFVTLLDNIASKLAGTAV